MKFIKSTAAVLLAAVFLFTFGGCAEEIIISIEAGGDISVVYCDSGIRYMWGSNEAYRTDDEMSAATERREITIVDGLIDFASGADHTVWLTLDGLLVSGSISMAPGLVYSRTGRLGSPVLITGAAENMSESKYGTSTVDMAMTDVTSVKAGDGFTVILKSNGTVWAWGDNSSGQLGTDKIEFSIVPIRVGTLEGISAIAAGKDGFCAALDMDGNVWTWGGDISGNKSPQFVEGIDNAVQVVCGTDFRAVLKSDGTVWTWGSNDRGQLGNSTFDDSLKPQLITGLPVMLSLTAGEYFMTALDEDGYVWTWGANDMGQLGRDTSGEDDPGFGACSGIDGIIGLSSGWNHTMALKKDGTVWTWGADNMGQLGREAEGGYDFLPGKTAGISLKITI